MKFRFGKTKTLRDKLYDEKRNLEEQWHKWFAWYPVCVNKNTLDKAKYAWLEYVWRKDDTTMRYHDWLYKELQEWEK